MKIAIPEWNGRISPVLDTARQLLIAEIDDSSNTQREVVNIPQLHPILRAKFISDLKIDKLICGAVSRQLELLLIQAGVRLIPWITGDIDEIVLACAQDRPLQGTFSLPGCCRMSGGRRRMGRGYRRRNNEINGKHGKSLRRKNEDSGFFTGE